MYDAMFESGKKNARTQGYDGTNDDNGNAMFQSYLSKLFKKETG